MDTSELARRIKEAAYLEGDFILRSGKRSKYYLDKYLFETHDGHSIETVMIPENGRHTVCISTQIGCPMACTFCATGLLGISRNLKAREISEQVKHGGDVKAAETVGATLAQRAIMQGFKKIIFDRGPYKYHGRVKALADSARKAGLEF